MLLEVKSMLEKTRFKIVNLNKDKCERNWCQFFIKICSRNCISQDVRQKTCKIFLREHKRKR